MSMKDFAFLRAIAMIAAGSSGASACAEVASEEAASLSAEDSTPDDETEPLALLQSLSVSTDGNGCKSGTWTSDGAASPSIKFRAFEAALNPPAKQVSATCTISLRTQQPANVGTGITRLIISGEGAIPSGTRSQVTIAVSAIGNSIIYSDRFTFNGNFYGSWEKPIAIPNNLVAFGCGKASLNVRLLVSTASDSGGLGSLVVREVKRVGTVVAPCGG